MRLFSIPTALLFLGLVGYGGSQAFGSASPVADRETIVKELNGVFRHTQNLRGGEGVRCSGRARRPGVPFAFHIDKQETPADASFTLDEGLGVYALQTGDLDDPTVPLGTLYYTDAAKTHPAGRFVTSSSGPGLPSWTKIEVQRLAGSLQGIDYKSEIAVDANGKGSIIASGNHPKQGRYVMKGSWQSANLGAWSQRWDLADGSWETDAYSTLADGTSTLEVRTGSGIRVDLAFAADLSGRGTISGPRKGEIEWDEAGDGTIKWADGGSLSFVDWEI